MGRISRTTVVVASLAVIGVGGRALLARQPALPTTQPNLLQITIEEVKVGHDGDHAKNEAQYVAAFERAKSPYYSIGLVALTGGDEAWFLTPYASNKAWGDWIHRSVDDPALSAELDRLGKADATHITAVRSIAAAGRKDLSKGAFPDAAKQRFYDIAVMRVRPGHEPEFEAAAKAFGAASERVAPSESFRVYEVTAGMPGPTYLVVTSVTSFDGFDAMQSGAEAIMKGMTPPEQAAMQKFGTDALITAETHRLRVDPAMSYVPAEVRKQDPAFWMPKTPVAPKKPVS